MLLLSKNVENQILLRVSLTSQRFCSRVEFIFDNLGARFFENILPILGAVYRSRQGAKAERRKCFLSSIITCFIVLHYNVYHFLPRRLYGSYENFQHSLTTKALQDLTGGIVQNFPLQAQDRFVTYQVLNSAVPRSTLLIASICLVRNLKLPFICIPMLAFVGYSSIFTNIVSFWNAELFRCANYTKILKVAIKIGRDL